jgi:hypothetical protein
VRAVLHKLTLNQVIAAFHVVAIILRHARIETKFGLERTHAIKRIACFRRTERINAIFVSPCQEEAIITVLTLIEIIAGRVLTTIEKESSVPTLFAQHFQKCLLRAFISFSRAKVPRLRLFFVLLLRQLHIADAIGFVSQIAAKEAMSTVTAVVEKSTI